MADHSTGSHHTYALSGAFVAAGSIVLFRALRARTTPNLATSAVAGVAG